jgi:hypothetical protein
MWISCREDGCAEEMPLDQNWVRSTKPVQIDSPDGIVCIAACGFANRHVLIREAASGRIFDSTVLSGVNEGIRTAGLFFSCNPSVVKNSSLFLLRVLRASVVNPLLVVARSHAEEYLRHRLGHTRLIIRYFLTTVLATTASHAPAATPTFRRR